jgi:hypothetical protein
LLTFEELTEARRSLQTFCLLHEPSLLQLQSGVSFKLLPTEKELGSDKVRHLSTTATCLSSLLDCPPPLRTKRFDKVKELESSFASNALNREFKEWISEGSAGIYCRCRTLPMVIACSKNFDQRLCDHIGAIFDQLNKRPNSAQRYGIGEAGSPLKEEDWYPPNAFHTYWTVSILDHMERKFPLAYEELDGSHHVRTRRNGMLLWGRQTLGFQIGLHSASPQSSMLDSDQLAWALALYLRFDEELTLNIESRDLLKQAFKCLFSTQNDGTWRHYKPLFHYKEAGNAYCYVFETFAAFLESALCVGDRAVMIRELLKPYCKNLLDLWQYADSTKIDLRPYRQLIKQGAEPTIQVFGWCSGHRTNVTDPESWASASVFSYSQALRRLLGIWCREEAFSAINTPEDRLSRTEANATIMQRGKTWGTGKNSVAEQLTTMFANPARMHECDDRLEPDSQPIEKNHARSAILFGPPGTSKTTLVRALADVIGWKYVELHASHFVAEGLPDVQKTADKIFKQLLEVDHAVVLFDEIDELVRERDMEKDAFGRFLTTSMLPKLAELWEKRKIIYFVATNHINYFDSAIIRSHRFDALILVSPPSFEAKQKKLQELLPKAYSKFNFEPELEAMIEKAFEDIVSSGRTIRDGDKQNPVLAEKDYERWRESEMDTKSSLAKFLLLRFDELDELAYHLTQKLPHESNESNDSKTIATPVLKDALEQVADSQWRKNKSYADFDRDKRSERRDYEMIKAWEVLVQPSSGPITEISVSNDRGWMVGAVNSLTDIKIEKCTLSSEVAGSVRVLHSEPIPAAPSGQIAGQK